MLNRLRLAVIAAIAFGLIAGYGIYDFLRQQRLALAELRAASEDVVVEKDASVNRSVRRGGEHGVVGVVLPSFKA